MARHRVETLFDSNLESVDSAEAATVEAAHEIGFNERDLHKIRLAVRECVTNAVVHGNRYEPGKRVYFRLTVSPGCLTVVVRDQGAGFDPDRIPDPCCEENLLKHSGRGLLMIREFMDDVEVRRTDPCGTEVIMSKRLAGSPV